MGTVYPDAPDPLETKDFRHRRAAESTLLHDTSAYQNSRGATCCCANRMGPYWVQICRTVDRLGDRSVEQKVSTVMNLAENQCEGWYYVHSLVGNFLHRLLLLFTQR